MNDGQHVREDLREWLWRSREERIERILRPCWIGYTRSKEILQRMEDLLNHPKTHRMPNLLIVGDSNNGKTALIQRFLMKYPANDDPDGEHVQVPVLVVEAPPAPDENRLYGAILDGLGADYSAHANIFAKQEQAYGLIRTIGVRMLIIDEIQNLLAGSYAARRRFLNAIKRLSNELRIPIVAAGVQEAYSAIHTDSQMANRFEPAPLRRWRMSREYLQLLCSFERMLPLRKASNLTSEKMAQRLLAMSEGTIGELSNLLTRAAVLAVRTGAEQITMDVLSKLEWCPPSKRKWAAQRAS